MYLGSYKKKNFDVEDNGIMAITCEVVENEPKPKKNKKEKVVYVDRVVEKEVIKEVVVEKPVIVEKEVIKEVLVNNNESNFFGDYVPEEFEEFTEDSSITEEKEKQNI